MINRIQLQILRQLGSKLEQEPDEYIRLNSKRYLNKEVNSIAELSEEQADKWIHKAYLESLA